MTPVYAKITAALFACTMLPGTWDRRFVRSLVVWEADGKIETERQREQMLRLVHKYRRQIPTSVVLMALDAAERAGWEAASGPAALVVERNLR